MPMTHIFNTLKMKLFKRSDIIFSHKECQPVLDKPLVAVETSSRSMDVMSTISSINLLGMTTRPERVVCVDKIVAVVDVDVDVGGDDDTAATFSAAAGFRAVLWRQIFGVLRCSSPDTSG